VEPLLCSAHTPRARTNKKNAHQKKAELVTGWSVDFKSTSSTSTTNHPYQHNHNHRHHHTPPTVTLMAMATFFMHVQS
jgi:hypothetical protein